VIHIGLISADSSISKIDKMIEIGIEQYILKPILFRTFKDYIESLVNFKQYNETIDINPDRCDIYENQ
jgi:response regulator of citrate/malate metabolism